MKQYAPQVLRRLASIGCFLALVLSLLDFNIRLLFDWKSLLLVLFGTLLLTAGCYKKTMAPLELRECILWNSLLAGLFTSFMLLFSTLYQNTEREELLPHIALCMRPLFYTFLVQLLCRFSYHEQDSSKDSKKVPLDVPSAKAPAYAALTIEEIRYLLRENNLTERELEIALSIWKNMPNKEIANTLFISESTVKKHTTSLYKKLQVTNREQLKQYLDQLEQTQNKPELFME